MRGYNVVSTHSLLRNLSFMLNEMLYVVKQIMYHEHWRPSGLKSGGALTKYVRGGTEKVEHIYT